MSFLVKVIILSEHQFCILQHGLHVTLIVIGIELAHRSKRIHAVEGLLYLSLELGFF